jgi:murein DD-endopeptidase MepM/ murein hydrolase activator NlpD
MGEGSAREGLEVVRKLVADRRVVALVAAVAVCVPAFAAGAPGVSVAEPMQEGPSDEQARNDDALVAINVDVADGDAEALSGALDEINANVGKQLGQLGSAEKVVKDRMQKLAAADQAIQSTQGKIDGLTNASDSVVVTTFINPPLDGAIESITAESVEDSTVKQAILQMRSDRDAAKLKKLTDARAKLRDLKRKQVKIRAEAQRARQDAEAAVDDLKAAFSQQTEFITQIQQWMVDPDGAAKRSGLSADEIKHLEEVKAQLAGKIKTIQDAEAAKKAAEELAAQQARTRVGGFSCPLPDGSMHFTDTWGAARSSGRTHKGTDMMAPRGTPALAPSSGRVVYRSNSLGGLTYRLYADDGHMYYGAHLSAYVGSDRWVPGGTLIGKVGNTGNASATAPHLHFEYHPNGGAAVNPYSRLVQVCKQG